MPTKLVIQRGPRSWKFTLDEARFVSSELRPLMGQVHSALNTAKKKRRRRRRKVTKT